MIGGHVGTFPQHPSWVTLVCNRRIEKFLLDQWIIVGPMIAEEETNIINRD